ncbi:hypothetical protein SCP_0105100 [Sparassis crispa]|uniref:Uncharacterized protein n=1 Tax=Sparassis crispa TaxID=139825 RepID=A0A401G637_9APHY|nr:hypothetical protein SCP_0105100 [Sparassis crispa]GBE77630.1 hypothetical protein SCP_0105100 [Sparassis crispa]
MVIFHALMDVLRVVAGTVLATGWLLLSIVSPLGRLLPGLHSATAKGGAQGAKGARSDPPKSPLSIKEVIEVASAGSVVSVQQDMSGHVRFAKVRTEQSVQPTYSRSPDASPPPASPPLTRNMSPLRQEVVMSASPIASEADTSHAADVPTQENSKSVPPPLKRLCGNAFQHPPRSDTISSDHFSSASSDTVVSSPVSCESQDAIQALTPPPKKHKLLRMTSVPLGNTKKHRNSCMLRKHNSLSSAQHTSTPRPPPPLRTDPYQAPYFFPTPASPEAADYIHQVRRGRALASTALPDSGSEPPADHLRTARRSLDLPKFSPPTTSVKDLVHEEHRDDVDRPRKRHWHFLHRPHNRSASLGSDARTLGSDSGYSEVSR